MSTDKVIQSETYDILITNTQIVDGTGKAAFKGNIAIKGDKIAAVGETGSDAKTVIDGAGLITCPGFIDTHSHADGSILLYPLAANLVMQGITTFIGGMCGYSMGPRAEDFYFGLPKEEGEQIFTWTSFGEYLDTVQAAGLSVNYVPNVGHGMIRQTVMGDDFRRKATPAEIEEMKKFVAEAMESGSYGLSTGLDYLPGKFADNDEIAPLAEIARDYGGKYFSHTRMVNWEWPTQDPEAVSHARYLGPPENVSVRVYEGAMEAIDIGKRTGIPVHMGHMINLYMTPQPHPEFLEEATAKATVWALDQATKEGVDFSYDVITLNTGISPKEKMIDAFCSNFYLADSPNLAWLSEISADEFIEKLKTREFRDRLRRIHDDCNLAFGDGVHTKVNPYWMDCFTILRCTNTQFEGRILGELSREKQTDPLELMFDLMVDDPEVSWIQHLDLRLTEVMQAAYLAHPAAFPCTDSMAMPAVPDKEGEGFALGPFNTSNPPNNCYSVFPNYIKTFVKKRKQFSLEKAIKKATFLPAQRFRLTGRGVLTPGAFGDIVVFDLESITDNTDFLKPAQAPSGIEYVLVNGTLVHKDRAHTGEQPGKVLRHTPVSQ